MIFAKSMYFVTLCMFVTIRLANAQTVETFPYTVENPVRRGEAELVLRPDFDSNSTIIDFHVAQQDVVHLQYIRVAMQFMEDIDKNGVSWIYRSVVFTLKIPMFSNDENGMAVLTQKGKNYNRYRGQSEGFLDRDEYIQAILFNKTGFFDPFPTWEELYEDYQIIYDKIAVSNPKADVKLSVKVPHMSPFGYHRVWYRWAFYDDWDRCIMGQTCLGPATINGQEGPYFYSTFQNLSDFLTQQDKDWIMALYWTLFALSFFLVHQPSSQLGGQYISYWIRSCKKCTRLHGLLKLAERLDGRFF